MVHVITIIIYKAYTLFVVCCVVDFGVEGGEQWQPGGIILLFSVVLTLDKMQTL